MAIDLVNVPSAQLRKFNADAATNFRAMRESLVKAGPLDAETCELIVIASFATVGFEASFKIHVLRSLKGGIPAEKMRHAVLVTLGATTPLATVTDALRWIDEAAAEHAAAR
jgi:alkylhydroperoxidase/carboxymuconolactone decarboxylase family protein YurZ